VQWLRSVVEGYGELLEREDKESTNEESDDRNADPVTWVQIEREAGPIANDILSVIRGLKLFRQASIRMLFRIEEIDLAAPFFESNLPIDSKLSNDEIDCLDRMQQAMRSSEWYSWLNNRASSIDEMEIGDAITEADGSLDNFWEKTEDLRHLATVFETLAELAGLQKGKPLWIENTKKLTESKCIEWLVEKIFNFNYLPNTTSKRFPLDHVVQLAQIIHDSVSSPKALPVLDTDWGKLEFNRIKARMKRHGGSPGSSRLEITEDDSVHWIPDPIRPKIQAAKDVLHRAPRARKERK
jgi:hypothetical protein